MAGSLRKQYPSSIKIIRVLCTGRVDVRFILKALNSGADGVIVAGCREGDCHFKVGNLRAKKRVEYLQNLLKKIGVEPQRVKMINLSASEGVLFAEEMNIFYNQIKKLGPLFNFKENKGENNDNSNT